MLPAEISTANESCARGSEPALRHSYPRRISNATSRPSRRVPKRGDRVLVLIPAERAEPRDHERRVFERRRWRLLKPPLLPPRPQPVQTSSFVLRDQRR